jgi:hypothetical protein
MRVTHTDTAALEERWQPRALVAAAGGDAERRWCARSWLILADATGVGEALTARLRANREQVTVARWGTAWRQHDAHFELRAGERADMDRLVAAVGGVAGDAADAAVAATRRIDHVVHLWSLDARLPEILADRSSTVQPSCFVASTSLGASEACRNRDTAAGLATGLDAALDAAQTLAAVSARHLAEALVQAGSVARLWLTTRGSRIVTQDAARAEGAGHASNITPSDLQQVAIHGLALAIGREHPELRCTTIDLDGASRAPAQVTLLTAELLADDPETRIAWRRGTRYAACLVAAPRPREAAMSVLEPA